MSASKEKKNRQNPVTPQGTSFRTAREAQQRKEEKRSNILYAAIAILFVVVAAVTLTWKSNIIQRSVTAVTINGQSYTAGEVEYYYKNLYQNFVNNYSSYLSYMGLDTSKSLDQQKYSDTQTWRDYFLEQALQQMSSVHALNDAAAKDNFTWTDDLQSQLDSNWSSLESAAKNYGYSTKQYLRLAYGLTMTEKVYKEQLKLSLLASAYSTNYQNGLTYTADQISQGYQKDTKSYDVVDYKIVTVDGSVATTDASGNTVDVTDQMKTDALAAAKDTANSIYAGYKAGGDLSQLADSNDKATYNDNTGGTYSDSVLMNWLFDDSRKAGDNAMLEDTTNSSYYVVVYEKRYRNEYDTVNVRHILIEPEATTLASTDDGYDADVAQKKADAKKKAEDLLAQWKSGEATEDSFAKLANENSADTGSSDNGGLYSQVYKGEMETAFNDWCFDSSRKTGDTGVVETSYGYHVMYFVGTDLPYWQVQVTNALKSNDYNTWYTALTKDYTATQHSFGIQYVD